MLAKTAVIWRRDWGWKIHFQEDSPIWLLTEVLISPLSISLWQSSWLPSEWDTQEKEQGRSHSTFPNSGSEVAHHHFHPVLFIGNKLRSLFHTQGEQSYAFTSWRQEYQRSIKSIQYFKTTTWGFREWKFSKWRWHLDGQNFTWLTLGRRAIKWKGQHEHRRSTREECRRFSEGTEISSIRTHLRM